VRESARQLGREGWSVEALPVTRAGIVDVEAFVDGIDENTSVAALMLVNNEIGTINPVSEVARALADKRPDVHLHCDAVQALGKIPVDVRALGAHSVAFAGHKLHAPKGVGALWVREGSRIEPLWSGGGQQEGIRSGTLNVPGIAGLGAAAELAAQGSGDRASLWAELATILQSAAGRCGVATRINGGEAPRAPHVLSIAFQNVPAEPLLHVLESRGVLVSAGSACAERSRKPSPVLTAIGVGAEWGTLRFSFGRDTTVEQVEQAAEILVEAVKSF
jgi:cysteine desulfurase